MQVNILKPTHIVEDRLGFYQNFVDPNLAIEFEKKLKKWSRVKKQALIDGDFDRLQYLSECRNATHHKYKPDVEE